ncbi:hypothetical protein LQZ19_00370 [Treponema primitia]|uniref:hypothetical protein n=1 Tax=Treponema primitia TaxID=88058 RepID=UPI003980046D
MTIRKTIDIPTNREVHFDIVLPETMPCGKREVILEFPQETPKTGKPQTKGPAKSLRGILKGRGITGEEFEEMQREDLLTF